MGPFLEILSQRLGHQSISQFYIWPSGFLRCRPDVWNLLQTKFRAVCPSVLATSDTRWRRLMFARY